MSEITDNNGIQAFHHQISDTVTDFFFILQVCVTMVNQVRLIKSYILVIKIISTPSLLKMQNPK